MEDGQQLSSQMKSVLETLASISNASLASPTATISNTHSSVSGTPEWRTPSVITSVSTTQAVTYLSSQLYPFSGTEDEDVDIWIKRVDQAAAVHGVSDSVKLLCATGKLQGHARDWFDFSPFTGEWLVFKNAITKHFKKRIPFYIVMQKVEARRWNYNKESFLDYATAKLKLIHPLNCSARDQIQLIIGDISSLSIRSAAASIDTDDVDIFLDRMCNITNACGNLPKKTSPIPTRRDKDKAKENLGPSQKRSSSPKNYVAKDVTCNYCKSKSHVKTECLKLKKKEQLASVPSTSASVPVAVTEEVVQPIQASAVDSSTVGCIQDDLRLKISHSVIEINSLNGNSCNLFALVDTGSPVSFLKESIFKIFCGQKTSPKVSESCKFRALNNTPIEVNGIQEMSIGLSDLPNVSFKANFRIVNCDGWSSHAVLGCDFLSQNNLSLIFSPTKAEICEKVRLFSEIASTEIIEDNKDNNCLSLDVHTDFGVEVDKQVKDIIVDVQDTIVEKNDDNHCVTVPLKDNSTFTFAPRRFAYTERKQIRDIIDDLLSRNIIKQSVSPYCARIVPVRKKNGQLRLYVDLRPLNDRVHKQKYPFPVIEDCISLLGGKKIFMVLDLKDGFHQIKIHPEHTKFFSFATPDGQYEFLRLPFGYSEAPAEFQKRLVQVLQPLIRTDRVIIYIDDILIASETINENLDVLRQVLLLLKRYDFELNFRKCRFLRSEIEYLGFVIKNQSITLSERHVNAIRNFPVPKDNHQVQRFLGLVSFFCRFISNFAMKAKPLYQLLKKSIVFLF